MLTFDIITLFPELFSAHLNTLPLKRALEKNLLKVNLHNLRDFAIDKRGTVDDKPYGGGVGMILMIEPIYKALESISKTKNHKIVLLAPSGKKYTQKTALEFSKCEQIILICGRYEGVDARVESLTTDVISIGDYVLSGGELPALAIMESTVRLIPNVLEKEQAVKLESFSDGFLEHPQYTRPEDFKGVKVPEVLLSGDHKRISDWKKKNSEPVS